MTFLNLLIFLHKLPKYRTPCDGHWTNQITVTLSINNIIQIQPFYEVDKRLNRPKRCISPEEETVFSDMFPDNNGVDDFLKSLDIPAQETCSNVPISKSMCQFPVLMITNCQIGIY
jgi:hypothetical protein